MSVILKLIESIIARMKDSFNLTELQHVSSEVPPAKAKCMIHLDLKSCFCPKATKSTQILFSLLLS